MIHKNYDDNGTNVHENVRMGEKKSCLCHCEAFMESKQGLSISERVAREGRVRERKNHVVMK
jgi:hypothetical protein